MQTRLQTNKLKQFFTRNPFRKEITLVIILKLLGLFAIWYLFFAHPNTVSQQNIVKHIFYNNQ